MKISAKRWASVFDDVQASGWHGDLIQRPNSDESDYETTSVTESG